MDIPLDEAEQSQLAVRADRLGFESPETYARTILKTVLNELEGSDSGPAGDNSGDHDENVQARLEDLGYL